MDDKIFRKIKCCLALAKSSNANEAATALRQAQAMMEQHGITREDVAASDVGSHVSQAAGLGKTPPAHMTMLANMIAVAFAVEPLYRAHQTFEKWEGSFEFYGIDSAPEIAGYAFEVLARQLRKDRNAFIGGLKKRLKRSTKVRRGDLYAQGWVQAVRHKVVPRRPSEAERRAIAVYRKKHWTDVKTAQGRDTTRKARKYDLEARLQGLVDGDKVEFHQGVHGSKRAALH